MSGQFLFSKTSLALCSKSWFPGTIKKNDLWSWLKYQWNIICGVGGLSNGGDRIVQENRYSPGYSDYHTEAIVWLLSKTFPFLMPFHQREFKGNFHCMDVAGIQVNALGNSPWWIHHSLDWSEFLWPWDLQALPIQSNVIE